MPPTRRAFVGAALAAMRSLQSAGFDPDRNCEQARSHRSLARAADTACFRGSGLGRDAAVAVRGLRSRPQLRASPLPQKPCSCRRRGVFLWERPWPRQGFRCPRASIQVDVGIGRPLPQKPGPGASHRSDSLLWERPWPRQGFRCPQASIQADVGVGRPLPQKPGPGASHRSDSLLWERPWPRRGFRCPRASIQADVGVGRPLPVNPGSVRSA